MGPLNTNPYGHHSQVIKEGSTLGGNQKPAHQICAQTLLQKTWSMANEELKDNNYQLPFRYSILVGSYMYVKPNA